MTVAYALSRIQRRVITGTSNIDGLPPSETATYLEPTNNNERIIVDVTPEYLTNFFQEYTDTQAWGLVQNYIGKWIRISGFVRNVNSHSDSIHVLLRLDESEDSIFGSRISASFKLESQMERAKLLRRNQQISIIGQIYEVNERYVSLDKCEFVE